MSEDLTKLPNIGPTLAAELSRIGVDSYEALAELGSVEAVLRIGDSDLSVCCNKLYALEGAIQGKRWHGIPKEERAALKREFERARSDQMR